MTEENTTELYQYPLSSPLPFQAGDILGFFQPATSTSQLGLLYEGVTATTYQLFSLSSPASQFNIATAIFENRIQPLVSVETGNFYDYCSYIQSIIIVISCNVHFITLHEIQIFYCTACRPSRLWVWFYECGEDENST